jgi:hypothetical protein
MGVEGTGAVRIADQLLEFQPLVIVHAGQNSGTPADLAGVLATDFETGNGRHQASAGTVSQTVVYGHGFRHLLTKSARSEASAVVGMTGMRSLRGARLPALHRLDIRRAKR